MNGLITAAVATRGMDHQAVFQINDGNNLHTVSELRILVFEYICGGGLAGQPLPTSLAAEGGMMLQALLAELKCLDGIQLCVLLDQRCEQPASLTASDIVWVNAERDIFTLLPALLTEADLFWPLAPESDGILQKLVELAVAAGVEAMASNPCTLAICADKYLTYQALAKHALPLVETRWLGEGVAGWPEPVVVKIADGVGCLDSYALKADQLPALTASLSQAQRYLVQPYVTGQAASLSCLFKHGQAWLLCYNHQHIVLEQGRFNLRGCRVNVHTELLDFYQKLASRIAAALPGLWGYVGIDLIETAEQGPLILEINPRLTSSYAGIRQATGINVAEQVLCLRQAEPNWQATRNETTQVSIH